MSSVTTSTTVRSLVQPSRRRPGSKIRTSGVPGRLPQAEGKVSGRRRGERFGWLVRRSSSSTPR